MPEDAVLIANRKKLAAAQAAASGKGAAPKPHPAVAGLKAAAPKKQDPLDALAGLDALIARSKAAQK